MPAVDPALVIGALREVADTVILPRYNKLDKEHVRSKTSANDLVTIADEEGEQRLAVTLPKLLPGSVLIGEESVAKNASLLGHISNEDWVWIVDPVDGTLNFVNGSDVFCTMVALTHKGETVMGFIHHPLSGKTIWSARGEGAYVSDASGAVTPVKTPALERNDLAGLTAALYDKELAPIKGKFGRIARSGCAGHDYWAAAEGRLHIVSFRKLQPWDHAPGLLIHAEAGGYARMLDGEAYSPGRPTGLTGVLAAPSQDIWANVVAVRQMLVG
ncbi:MAG: inositol monophosphatase [Rhodospirillaceae bacterium]|nr:inositol monophosphatase [Rhodospirillaceae bacterium]